MSIASKSSSIFKRDLFLYITKIFTSIIIARKLGPEMLGAYAMIALIPSYAESFGRLKFDVAAVYFMGKKKYELGEVISTLHVLAVLTSGLVVSLFLLNFDWIYNLFFSKASIDLTSMICFILLQIPLQFLSMNYCYIFLHKEEVAKYNYIVMINALGSSLFSVAMLMIFDLGLWSVVMSSVFGTFAGLIYGIIALGKVKRIGGPINAPLIKDLFNYGSKMYIGGLVAHFQIYTTNLLTAYYLLPTQVGFFSMARNLGGMLDRIPAALTTILFPRLAKTTDSLEAAKITARAARITFLLLILIGIFAIIFIQPAIYLMYGRAFLPAVLPFVILIPGIILSGAASSLAQYFFSIDRGEMGYLLLLPPLAVQVAISVIFIPTWGPKGAALAFSGGLVTMSLLNSYMFLRLSPCTLRGDLFIRKEDISYLWNFVVLESSKAKVTLKKMLGSKHAMK